MLSQNLGGAGIVGASLTSTFPCAPSLLVERVRLVSSSLCFLSIPQWDCFQFSASLNPISFYSTAHFFLKVISAASTSGNLSMITSAISLV